MSEHTCPESRKRKRGEIEEGAEDFEQLARAYPNFEKEWKAVRSKQRESGGSFSSSVTQAFNIALARAQLHSKFGLVLPSLPHDRLCPPVPNRLTYVQWLQKHLLPLLCEENDHFVDTKPLQYRGIDIGTGASCIYPILFASTCSNEWNMLGTDIDELSIESARANIEANKLEDRVQVQLVRPTLTQEGESVASTAVSSSMSSGGPIARTFEIFSCGDEQVSTTSFDFCMTNPPFFDTDQELEPRADARGRTPMTAYEGSYPGGEMGFVSDMIRDSLVYRDRIGWYSTMCGKKSSYMRLKQILIHLLGPGHVQTMEFSPGYMTRWFLAWTFRRPKVKSPAARIMGGTRNFRVRIDMKREKVDALNEVVGRIVTYCKTLPGWNLSTSSATGNSGKLVRIVEASPASAAIQVDENESLPPRILDGIDCNWDATVFLPKEGHFLVDITVGRRTETHERNASEDDASVVSVSLDCYRHSRRGARAVDKICSQLEGELSRSNRRWRRILKRQAEQAKNKICKLA